MCNVMLPHAVAGHKREHSHTFAYFNIIFIGVKTRDKTGFKIGENLGDGMDGIGGTKSPLFVDNLLSIHINGSVISHKLQSILDGNVELFEIFFAGSIRDFDVNDFTSVCTHGVSNSAFLHSAKHCS